MSSTQTGSDLVGEREGVVLLVSGQVKDTLGHPLPGAMVDTWQADGQGMYPIQDQSQNKYDLRGKFLTDEEGRYRLDIDDEAIVFISKPADYATPVNAWRTQRRIAQIYLAMRKCPQPIICLVQGAACGGGFSLALQRLESACLPFMEELTMFKRHLREAPEEEEEEEEEESLDDDETTDTHYDDDSD